MPRSAANPETPGNRAERLIEAVLFRARWLLAPFYLGLVVALGALLFTFLQEGWHEFSHLASLKPARVVVVVLSLTDLSLVANLLLIVIFVGYETFVSRLEVGAESERPAWMGSIDFAGLKLKLMGSLVAISAVVLMRGFMQVAEGQALDERSLGWLVAVHLTFVVSSLMLAVMDYLSNKTAGH
jgi:uncharacterized protein (TIGR00645 family)